MAIKALLGFDHFALNDTTWITKAPSWITRLEQANDAQFVDRVLTGGWVGLTSVAASTTFNRVQIDASSFAAAPVDTISIGVRIRCDVPPAAGSYLLYCSLGNGEALSSNGPDLGITSLPKAGDIFYVEFTYTFSTKRYTWRVNGVITKTAITTSTVGRVVNIGLRQAVYPTTERWSLKDVVISDDQGSPVGPVGPRKLVLTDAATGTYRADATPSPMSLRAVRGYAMASVPAQMALRSVVGYAMAAVPTPLPQGVTGKQAVLNMVLARSKKTRPATDFDIETPNVRTGDEYFNSTVKVIAQPASGLLGSMVFRYNRVPLNRMNLASNSFDLGTATSIYALLPAINAASGMILTTDDIEDAAIDPSAATVTLKSKPGSWWFLPNSTLVIGKVLTSINVPISSDTIDW